MFVSVIIAAGGRGVRLGAGEPKQLLAIGGASMLQRTLETFLRAACVNEVVVALPSELVDAPPSFLRGNGKPVRLVAGGTRRQDSVAAAFARTSPEADVVVIHDAARPFVTESLIERTVAAAREAGAAIAALPVHDTVKQTSEAFVARTLPREQIVLAQTPQAFRRDVLAAALERARQTDAEVTDEAMLVEQAGFPVRVVAGEPRNVKITTAEDLRAARQAAADGGRASGRVGNGYDLHRLVEGRPFVLAGVAIASAVGPLGHSDADVLCHALTDAVFGASALGDIGRHFPDTDERWRGAAGLDLLGRAVALARDAGFTLVNADAVVIVERPKLAAYVPAICANLAGTLGVDLGAVSVKAKTNEGVGAIGRGDAIACHAVAMVTDAP
jgi:2-C-methyl-D-erythritol 4-phosphate cytidylyltransferase/2-C-methyl-D-erythritol 2,4-cyclodiphosphate synthase